MKSFTKILFSSSLTFILLVILAIALAGATFIEDAYDTLTAKLIVYNAKWFELLFILLVINLVGHIIKFKLFSIQKLPALLFHLAFVIMMLSDIKNRVDQYSHTILKNTKSKVKTLHSHTRFMITVYNIIELLLRKNYRRIRNTLLLQFFEIGTQVISGTAF